MLQKSALQSADIIMFNSAIDNACNSLNSNYNIFKSNGPPGFNNYRMNLEAASAAFKV